MTAWVVNSGCPRLRDQRHVLLLQSLEELWRALGVIVLGVADQGRVDVIAPEQDTGGAGILRRHNGDLFQDTYSTQRDVLQVAYWCGDYIQDWHLGILLTTHVVLVEWTLSRGWVACYSGYSADVSCSYYGRVRSRRGG